MNRSRNKLVRAIFAAALTACLFAAPAAFAQNFVFNNDEADFDRWMYPFNASPGVRPTAPVFGAVGADGFDNADGQFLIGFNVGALGLPSGLDPSRYQINSVTVTVTHSTGTFAFDPTYDGFQTHLDPSDPDFVADSDAGRPIMLTGAGLQNGFTSFGFDATVPGAPVFEEGDFFGTGGGFGGDARNAIPFIPGVGNVSNFVTDGFDIDPFAVGQATSGVLPGGNVAQGETFSFDVTLTDPGILAYLQQGLSDRSLFFTVVSLHEAAQQAGGTNPNFFTRDDFNPAAIAPSLSLDVTITSPSVIPLPAAGPLGLLGLAVAAATRRRRTRG